jgi:hypothetical protein
MQPIRFLKCAVRPAPFIAVAIFLCASARAEPSFARKYRADCTLCHTVYPHLNRTGYLFRRLGYRLPSDVQRRRPRLLANTLCFRTAALNEPKGFRTGSAHGVCCRSVTARPRDSQSLFGAVELQVFAVALALARFGIRPAFGLPVCRSRTHAFRTPE